MTTLPTTHRPTRFIAAAAVAAAIAAGALAWSLSQPATQPGSPVVHGQTQGTTPPTHHFQPTTSGGRVILGE